MYCGAPQTTRRTCPTRTARSEESGSCPILTPRSSPSSTSETTRSSSNSRTSTSDRLGCDEDAGRHARQQYYEDGQKRAHGEVFDDAAAPGGAGSATKAARC